jgi:hypothetical protein
MVTRTARHLRLASFLGLLAAGSLEAARASMPPGAAPLESQRLIVLGDLTTRSGRLRSLTADSISITLPDGRVETLPLRDVIAFTTDAARRPVADASPPLEAWRDATLSGETPQGLLQLVDGQQLPGLLASTEVSKDSSADRVPWASRQFGLLSIPLDSVKVLLLRPGAAKPEEASTSDVVHLVNGDRMEGFVAGVGASVGLESQGKVSELETSRVASIRLANAAKPPSGTRLWLSSGTICAAKRLIVHEDGKGEVTLSLPGATTDAVSTVEAGDLRAACFDVTKLSGLASMAMRVESDADRHWTPPPVVGDVASAPLGGADVELPGPMTVLWDVPGASRVAGDVELPTRSRTWGDCEVSIEFRSGGTTRPLWRRRLREGETGGSFNLPLPAASDGVLVVRLLEGENGPIMDQIVLRRVLVLRP